MLIATLYSHTISMAANIVFRNHTHYNRRKSLAKRHSLSDTKSQTMNKCNTTYHYGTD